MALVPATWFTAQRVFDGSDSPSHATTDLPIPPVSPSATPSSTPTPSATPSTPPATPPATTAAPTLTNVSPDAPRRIVSGTLIDSGFDSAVTTIDASSASEVARWESRGSPGSPGTDTVYVIGRTLADGSSAFADMPQLKIGGKVSIRTDNGTMTYTVSASTLILEAGMPKDPLFTEHMPGRLVLVGIRYDASGDRLDKALVVTARLSGAKKA